MMSGNGGILFLSSVGIFGALIEKIREISLNIRGFYSSLEQVSCQSGR